MSRRILKTYEDMLAEAELLVTEDDLDSQDRAAIQSFYNGRETMSPTEAESKGVTNIVNHLLGFDSMNQASSQINSIYTKSKVMFTVECPEAEAADEQKWGMCVTEKLNNAIKSGRRFKTEWKSLSGEIPLFGNATLAFRDNEDWCPRMVRPYVPRGTGILAKDIPYCVIPDYLTMDDLYAALRKIESCKKLNTECYWKERDVRLVITALENGLNETNGTGYISGEADAHEQSELEEAHAEGAAGLRTRIPVYFFYIGHPKDDKHPFDLVILPRLTPSQTKYLGEKHLSNPTCLYDHEDYFECAEHFAHPFFVDCQLGGRTTWHRVMGLGRLNYEADVETEEFFNEAMQGSRENLRRLYQVSNAADWELLKNWADGGGPSNVLPPGVALAEANKMPNFQYAFTTMEFLMNLTRKNSGSHYGSIANSKENELEINALERQSRNAEALAARFQDIYECTDALGAEILRRFLAPTPLPVDCGYAEVKKFQDELRKEGIPLAWLRKEKDGKFANITVKTNRSVGDGDKVRQAMANQAMMARISMFSGEAQKIILRRITAEETNDYDFAEQVVPYEYKPDANQVNAAETENMTCEKKGIIGYVPPLNDTDVDDVHIPAHLSSMQADIEKGKIRQWDQLDLAGFKAKGAHTMAHISKLKAVPEMKENVKQFEDQLQSLAKQGQEFENNLRKSEEANKLGPKEKQDMELKERGQNLKERQQLKLEEHRAAALDLSERKNAVTSTATAKQVALQEENTLHKQGMAEREMIERAKERSAASGERAEERTDGAEQPAEDNPVP